MLTNLLIGIWFILQAAYRFSRAFWESIFFRKMQTPTGADDARRWEDLPPEILGMIFEPLSVPDMFGSIPLVCKPWGEVVKSPYCWRGVDLEEWTSWFQVPWRVNRMLRVLITRSCGAMRKLCVCSVSDPSTMDFIAENLGSSLETLKLPGCIISDAWLQNAAVNISNVTYLDVSYCNAITSAGLELIGRTCSGLVRLHRNMRALDHQRKLSQEDEACAIATTMPNLKHLELENGYIGTEDVMVIINGCKRLEFLDIEGCWNVRLDEESIKQKFPQLRVRGPAVGEPFDDFLMEHYNLDQPLPDTSDDDEEDGPYDELPGHLIAYIWPPSP